MYVDQGYVATRLSDHRNNPIILKHRNKGDLKVAWAHTLPTERDGIERYLANALKPVEGAIHPNVTPVLVNLPNPLLFLLL